MTVTEAIENLRAAMEKEGISPEGGLGDELFLFTTTLAPVANVDLVVFNEKCQVLLIWRDDVHVGRGWHIPGGCIRFKETLERRIQKTAVNELGSEVDYIRNPVGVYEIFPAGYREGLENQNERGHFITLAYICKLKHKIELQEGMEWFDNLPDELLKVQDCYREDWDKIKTKARGLINE